MPDFRIKGLPPARRFPTEQYTQARTMAKGRSSGVEAVTGLLGGLEKGLSITQTLRGMKEKKAKAERLTKLAEILQTSPDVKKSGIPPELLMAGIEGGQAGQVIQAMTTAEKGVAPKGAMTEFQRFNIEKEKKDKIKEAVGIIRSKKYSPQGLVGVTHEELPGEQNAINMILSQLHINPLEHPELREELKKSYPEEAKVMEREYGEAKKILLKKNFTDKQASETIMDYLMKRYKKGK